MASSPVTAPAPKATPPNDSSPPPQVSSPPPEATKSPPPDEVKSPPPDESKSPPPEAKSPPPPPTPTPPAATPPPNTSPPPPIITPPPSSPPPSNNNSPIQPTIPTPPPPQNPLILAPPTIPTPPPPPLPGAFHPPPPVPHRTPSHHTPSSSDGGSSSSSNDTIGDKLPIIVGITAGLGLLFITMIIVIVICSKKRKKGTPMNNQLQYYGNPPPQGPKGAYYDNNPSNWYNNNPQMVDHQGNKMGPPPGLLVPPPPGAVWGPPPPPPPAANSSSELGSNLSDPQHMLPASPNGLQVNKSSFSYDELAAATNGFSQANLLGQGGFGYVHKGVFPNGKVVAVKSLKSGSGQGEREFQAEVEIISRVHHRHLVSLVGYCIAGGQRMLVYEFVPNKTLEFHLHGKGCPTMDWSKRMKIAMGAAKGLAYLHEDCHPRIIHRDIKTANILIDNNFEAMVADFGLAKLSSDTYTHVSTRIMGTFGYLAPEYASSGKLTEKSDVFSFGVMLLELITGRRPVDTTNTYMEDSLVDWARPILTRPGGDYQELVDPRLEGNYDSGEMACMIACASASIRHSARRRPKMSQIVRALEGDVSLEMLNEGVKPGQSAAFTSTEYDDSSYNASLQRFKKMAMESQDVGSTEYSGLTSTYGLNPSSSSDSSSGEVNQVPNIRHQY